MTFGELKTLFESYTGIIDDVDNAQLALWFNEAQLDLAYDLGPVASADISAADNDYSPGGDWLAVVACDIPYTRLPNGKLRFGSGSGKIYYRAMPEAFTGIDDGQESGLPRAAHYLPALFAAARYWDTESEGDGEESGQAAKWLGYYYQGKNLAKARSLTGQNPIDRWQVAEQ